MANLWSADETVVHIYVGALIEVLFSAILWYTTATQHLRVMYTSMAYIRVNFHHIRV